MQRNQMNQHMCILQQEYNFLQCFHGHLFHTPIAVHDVVGRTPPIEQEDFVLLSVIEFLGELVIEIDTCVVFHGIFGPEEMVVWTTMHPILQGFCATFGMECRGLHQGIGPSLGHVIGYGGVRTSDLFGPFAIEIRRWFLQIVVVDVESLEQQILATGG